ncbi:MAG: SoxR reducing system RseC family protein [Dictyoglomus sp.]|nr:SoxR reducing system RseC family protein [Dictyoglomus sp.]MCX7941650.1 SoxR reducing system RseC family protein [Dictyoglomaceae bacterium]MDW8188198.1 SoxR reducing system RseC family protein [Dictyoglomus sp.]
MKEIGKVIDKKENIVVVELTPSSLCSSCSLCQRGKNSKFLLNAIDECSAEIGDIVSLEIPRASYYKATLLIYIIPLFFFLLGVFIGYFIFGNSLNNDPQLSGLILGSFGLILSFFIVKHLDKKIQKKSPHKYIPIVREIVQR